MKVYFPLRIRKTFFLPYFSVIKCTVPDVAHAMPTPESMIDYDTDVEYTCDPGYTNTSGDLIRTSKEDGSLTGSPPVCTSKLTGEYLFSLINIYYSSLILPLLESFLSSL